MKRNIEQLSDVEEPQATRKRNKVDQSTSTSTTLPLPCLTDPLQRPPTFQQPYQLLSFSYVSEEDKTSSSHSHHSHLRVRTLKWSNASMRYFVPPPSGANLAQGYEAWIKRPEERGRLDGLLEACIRRECEGERRRADVITWRGVMTK